MHSTTGLKGRAGGAIVVAALVLSAGLPAAAQVGPTNREQEEIARKNAILEQQKRQALQGGGGGQPQSSDGGQPGGAGVDAVRLKAQAGGDPAAAAAAAKAMQAQMAAQRAAGQQPGAKGVPPTGPGAGPGATGQTGATNPGASALRAPPGTPATPTGGTHSTGTHPKGAGDLEDGPAPGPDEVSFAQFADGMDLKAMVEYVAETLHVMIVGNDSLTGTVVLNGPLVIKKNRLIPLLNSLLETQAFTITSDPVGGFYKVIPIASTGFNPEGDLATTRIIPTPTIKPSTLADAINNQLGIAGQQTRLSYMDDLGVIIVTDSSRRIDALTDLVERVLERSQGQQFIRFDLKHVAAPVARQRVLDLLGVGATTGTGITPVANPAQPGQPAQMLTGVVTNLSDRLSIDAAGNALIFRGYTEESQRIEDALNVIDRPNMLHYKQYYAGKAASQIAELAERLGLGHVEMVDSSPQQQQTTTTTGFNPNQNRFNQQQFNAQIQQQQQQQNASIAGGPVMIVDLGRNLIIYYGTEAQQSQLQDLIGKFDTDQDEIVIANYKIKNQQAQDVADVLSGIVYGQSGPDNSSPFFGGGFGFNQLRNQFGNNQNQTTNRTNTANRNSNSTTTNRGNANQSRTNQQGGNIRPFGFGGQQPQNRGNTAGQTGPGAFDPDETFIMADTANNQVIVKAPKGQQEEFSKLIAKLDQRRPQVQIDVQIVSVTATDDFRLAFETQWLAGQFGLNTNFGVGSLTSSTTNGTTTTTTGGFTSRKSVNPNLPGITAALIKSNYVPIVMTALKDNSDTRILSSPQITVDDNVQATIESTDQQPTSTTSQTNSSTIASFGGYEEAGTTVTVTPSISEGGYMRLQYDIELSNFVGTGANGFPPPKQVRHVTSDSVTIPGETTIIVGGIKVDSKSNTVSKIPLLGDIPLLGNLFKDQSKNNSTTRLYVFITPRILHDANFRDLRLLTQGPLAEAGLTPDLPPLEPVMMDTTEMAHRPGLPVLPPREPEPTPVNPSGTPAAAPTTMQEGQTN